jgi:hypothetical protein
MEWKPGRVNVVLIRGYQEDTQETFSPGTIFDTTLLIWRMAKPFSMRRAS